MNYQLGFENQEIDKSACLFCNMLIKILKYDLTDVKQENYMTLLYA